MEALTKRKWIALTLIAVVLPVSLLTAFKLTGTIPHALTPDTTAITLEPIYWEMERPSYWTNIGEEIKNTYTDGGVTIEMGVFVAGYSENHPAYNYYDVLEFSIFVNATQGVILSSRIKYYPVDENAIILIMEDYLHTLILRNATATEINSVGTNSSGAYVAIKASGKPCYISSGTYWFFCDKNVNAHQVSGELEVLCFNGSVYKKIVTPLCLEVWAPEAGKDFTTAKSITRGSHLAYLDNFIDIDDYYVMWIEEGDVMNVQITYPEPYYIGEFDLYLYDCNKDLRASLCVLAKSVTEPITFTSDYTGSWFIRVHGVLGVGLYRLEVTIVQQ